MASEGDAEGYVGVFLEGEGAVGPAEVVLWQRFVAQKGACDAGVRARLPGCPGLDRGGLRGQPAYERSLHAGRPDNINVWHAVSSSKARSARSCAQVKSLRNT